MNPLFRILIIASTLTMPFIFPPQAHAELRSPCILTDSEKAMITKLTRMRDDVHLDHTNIKECLIFASHTILIRYEDGYMGMFGIGEGTMSDAKQEIPTVSQPVNELESGEPPIPHAGTEHETKIFTELDQIWRSTDSPDDLSPEQLAQADALVKELFATTPANEIQLATYNSLGFRGNRYLQIIQDIDSLPPEALVPFYEGYIWDSAIHARTKDIPSDYDKHPALEKLVHIFETTELNKKYHFIFDISQEIERIDPPSYAKLKQIGVISENTY